MSKFFKEIITAQWSRYRGLPNWTTQRYKTATEELLSPQQAICFIPPYEELHAQFPDSKKFEEVFWENDIIFEQLILKYAQMKWHIIYIVNKEWKRLKTNEEINQEDAIYLAFWKKWQQKYDFYFPVSKAPKIWYKTFDTRTYSNKEWENMTERHIWSPIIEIIQ